MSIIIADTSGSTLYTVPAAWDLLDWQDGNFSAASKIAGRFGQDGGAELSDKAVKPVRLPVELAYHAADAAALKAARDALVAALRNDGDPYRISFESGYYYNVEHLLKWDQERYARGLHYRSIKIKFTLSLLEPYMYADTGDSDGPTTITTSPQDITYTNNGTAWSWLKITWEPSSTGDITIANVTDGSQLLAYQDPAAASGDTVVIDPTGMGTVERDGTNTIRYFSGAFLRALPGANTIRVTGATGGGITLESAKRYL